MLTPYTRYNMTAYKIICLYSAEIGSHIHLGWDQGEWINYKRIFIFGWIIPFNQFNPTFPKYKYPKYPNDVPLVTPWNNTNYNYSWSLLWSMGFNRLRTAKKHIVHIFLVPLNGHNFSYKTQCPSWMFLTSAGLFTLPLNPWETTSGLQICLNAGMRILTELWKVRNAQIWQSRNGDHHNTGNPSSCLPWSINETHSWISKKTSKHCARSIYASLCIIMK